MANKKISELQSRTPALSDLMLVGDPSSGYSYKCTVTALATIIETDIADGFVTIGTTQTVSGAKTFSNNLTLTSVANTPTDPDKFLTLNASNVVTYRTGAEVLSDIGGQGSITLTTTGTSGAATLVGNTLNIPQYQSALTNPVTGTGTTNYVTKWTSSSAVGNSQIFDNGTNVGIGTNTPARTLDVNGIITTNNNLELTSANPTILWTTSNLRFYNNTNGVVATISSAGQLSLSSIPNATVDTDKFLVSDSGVIKYRTGAEVLSDIGGASSSSISGTTNYIPKFTSSSAIGNSVIYENSSNIGIGTTSPTQKLEISGTVNQYIQTTATDGSNAGIRMNSVGQREFGIFSDGALRFYDFTASTERMRITSGGNVGIGTSSPYTASNYIFVTTNGTNGSGYVTKVNTTDAMLVYSNVSASTISEQRALPLVFETSGTERLRISSTGDVGIGTSAPVANTPLTLQAASGYTDLLWLKSVGTNIDSRINFAPTGTGITQLNNTTGTGIALQISGAEKMRLDASGNLGIATSSPAAKLDVQGSSSDQIRLRTAATEYYGIGRNSSTGYLDFYGSQSGYVGYLFGGVNGTRMTLDASGNLGLGVSPSAWLSTNRAFQLGYGSLRSFTNSANTYLENNNYVNTSGTDIYLNNGAAGRYRIADEQHIWYQAPSGTAGNAISFTQAMTLDASGRLGIGTTSPTYKLVVSNGGALGFEIDPTSSSGGIVSLLTYDRSAGSYKPLQINSEDIRFQTGTVSTEKMRISSTGNVSIGNTNNTYKLDVSNVGGSVATQRLYGNDQANVRLRLENTGGRTWELVGGLPGANNSNFSIYDVTGTATRLTIDASGNLGIGTSSPAAKLDVQGSSSDQIRLRTAATEYYGIGRNSSTGYLDFYGSQSGYVGYLFGGVNGTRMTLDASGNLGLGVSPSAWLSTNRAFQLGYGSLRSFTNSANTYLENNNYVNTSGTDIYLNNGAAGRYRIADEQHIWYQAPSGTAGNAISFTQAMTLDASGRLGIGSTNPSNKLTVISSQTGTQITTVPVGKFVNTGNEFSKLIIGSDNANYDAVFSMDNNATLANTKLRIYIGNGTNSTAGHSNDQIVLQGNGNVGIGTTSPTRLLDVNGVIRTQNAGSAGAPSIELGTSAQGNGLFYPTTNTIAISTNDTERMRITSGGEVLINTTSDAGDYKLQVNGNSYLNGVTKLTKSVEFAHSTKSATYTLTSDDYTIGFDCAANRTANLPDAATCAGRVYVIYQYNTSGGINGVTLDGNSSQTINGNTTYSLAGYCDYTSVMIQSDGSNWVIISDSIQTGCL